MLVAVRRVEGAPAEEDLEVALVPALDVVGDVLEMPQHLADVPPHLAMQIEG